MQSWGPLLSNCKTLSCFTTLMAVIWCFSFNMLWKPIWIMNKPLLSPVIKMQTSKWGWLMLHIQPIRMQPLNLLMIMMVVWHWRDHLFHTLCMDRETISLFFECEEFQQHTEIEVSQIVTLHIVGHVKVVVLHYIQKCYVKTISISYH